MYSWKHLSETHWGRRNILQHHRTASLLQLTRIMSSYIWLKGEMASWKCWHKSLHALSRRGLTTLIKVALQHISLVVSTFAGPAQEHGAERSVMRGDEQGDNSSEEINRERESCINRQRAAYEWWQRFFKSGRIYNWINYSWLTVFFSTVCLTGPAVRVFLVSRNHCVPGRLLNSVLGAEACQLWQCCNKYQPSLLSLSLIPVQCTALLVGVLVSLTHIKSLKNPLHLCARHHGGLEPLQSTFFYRTYSRPGILIIRSPLENDHNHTLRAVIHLKQGSVSDSYCCTLHWMRKHCSGFFSSRESELEEKLSLLSALLPLHFLLSSCAMTFSHSHLESLIGESLAPTPQRVYHSSLQQSQGKLQLPLTTAFIGEARLQDLVTHTVQSQFP